MSSCHRVIMSSPWYLQAPPLGRSVILTTMSSLEGTSCSSPPTSAPGCVTTTLVWGGDTTQRFRSAIAVLGLLGPLEWPKIIKWTQDDRWPKMKEGWPKMTAGWQMITLEWTKMILHRMTKNYPSMTQNDTRMTPWWPTSSLDFLTISRKNKQF